MSGPGDRPGQPSKQLRYYVYFREAVLGERRDYKLGSRDMHGSESCRGSGLGDLPINRSVQEILPAPPGRDASEKERREHFQEAFWLLAVEVRDLMETLRGEEAS